MCPGQVLTKHRHNAQLRVSRKSHPLNWCPVMTIHTKGGQALPSLHKSAFMCGGHLQVFGGHFKVCGGHFPHDLRRSTTHLSKVFGGHFRHDLRRSTTHLSKVFGRHFRHDLMEVELVLIVDETVMEHTLSLVHKQSENLVVVTDHTGVGLQHACEIIKA